MIKRISAYLGLAKRGHKVHVGEVLLKKIEKNKIYLILLATDVTSQNQIKLKEKARKNKIPMLECLTSSELASALNYQTLSAVGLSDINLAKQLIKILKEEKL